MNEDSAICVLEGPLNALSLNKDANQVVVAGRNVLKIFSIGNDGFKEGQNLRSSKHSNLNFSSLDVAWSPHDDHTLASAATNGAIVIWDLNKTSKSKYGSVFHDHNRTAYRVIFHPRESHYLLSGSLDGTIKLFDLRTNTVTSSFESGIDSIRDVQFDPFEPFGFMSADEAGTLRYWDVRMPNQVGRQFAAHNGPIFGIDFHSELRQLATAGRDRLIKVWNMNNNRSEPLYQIQNVDPVNKVKWRPSRSYHLASCSMAMDFSIYVWDVRRPYVPFAAFEQHKDVTMGFLWRNNRHEIISVSKDGTLQSHLFKKASRPANHASQIGLALSPNGDICLAMSDQLIRGISNKYEANTPNGSTDLSGGMLYSSSITNPTKTKFYQRVLATAKLPQPSSGSNFKSPDTSSLIFFSRTSLDTIGQTWLILKAIFCFYSIASQAQHHATYAGGTETPQKFAFSGSTGVDTHESSAVGFSATIGMDFLAPTADTSLLSFGTSSTSALKQPMQNTGFAMGTTETDTDADSELEIDSQLANLTSGLKEVPDFFFGDGGAADSWEKMVLEEFEQFTGSTNLDHQLNPDWSLPSEAFQPRAELQTSAASSAATLTAVDITGTQSHSSPNNSSNNITPNMTTTSLNVQNAADGAASSSAEDTSNGKKTFIAMTERSIVINSELLRAASWDFSSLVKEMLYFYAEQSDIQMSISILIVLKDRIKHLIPVEDQERWYYGYLDLLSQFGLWHIHALVIKLSTCANIQMLSQQSSTYNILCGRCEKKLESPSSHSRSNATSYCHNCHNNAVSLCSICQEPVRGLFAWCRGCAHGGHLVHLRRWFADGNRFCPAEGCNHRCTEFG